MINKSLIVAFWVLGAFSVSAQVALSDDLVKTKLLTPYYNYVTADRELVYTQFNKSKYITGDDIWFTSWVLTPFNKRLSFSTTKLYVELWSGEKKLINRKILSVKAGTASNFIHIADSLTPGTYCFRAYTSWMRNFYDEKEFNVPVIILSPTVKNLKSTNIAIKENKALKENAKPVSKPDYDIQFLPESGHFIEGIDNVIGIKVTDVFGRGVSATVKVVDSTKNEIASFTTNQMGMSSFTIIETTNQTLHANIKLPDGNTRDIKLPKPEKQGITINTNTALPEFTWIRLQISKLSLLQKQSYTLMLHANGIVFNNYRISFTSGSSIQFKIKKKDLGNGIIYATLFNNDFGPVAERVFYNQNTTIKGRISLSTKLMENDTVKLTLTASDSLSKKEITKLSLSILPEGTLVNLFPNNLLAESRLRPGLKGDIENPGYYFEKYDTEHTIALDNLMIIQGWRKYDWPEITKGLKPKFKYPFEEGFTIKGEVKNWLKNKPELKSFISLISFKNNILLISPVDNNGQFHFNKLYLADSTYVIAAASSIKGTKWNRVLYMSIPEDTLNTPDLNQFHPVSVKKDETKDEIPNMTKGVIHLAEVVVTGKMKDPFAESFEVNPTSAKFFLTKENYAKYNSIEDILLTFFNIIVEMDQNGKYKFNMGRGISKSAGNPSIRIDNFNVHDPIELLSYPLNMVDAIAVDKAGLGGGINGNGNGSISVISRKRPLFEKVSEVNNIKRMIVKGYAQPKEYFEPKYLIQPENPDFAKYAAIYWKPELVTDSTGVASFKFVVPQPLNSFIIRAEGINFDGLIFLHQEKIELPDRK